jgi:hypothetical protein
MKEKKGKKNMYASIDYMAVEKLARTSSPHYKRGKDSTGGPQPLSCEHVQHNQNLFRFHHTAF